MIEELSKRIEQSVQSIQERFDSKLSEFAPKIGIILGSGLGRLADQADDVHRLAYQEIRGFPKTTVEGHAGELILCHLASVPVLLLKGRVHLYEGHLSQDVVHPLRTLWSLGIQTVIVTNASGGISRDFHAGDLMVISDHINLTGHNPLVGPNFSFPGSQIKPPRFPDMSAAYDRDLQELTLKIGNELGLSLRRGVYAGLLGPNYETPAEIEMLSRLGASAVGMSTVLEVIAAKHLSMKVLGLSCISNLAAGLSPQALSHQEVQFEAERASQKFTQLIKAILPHISKL